MATVAEAPEEKPNLPQSKPESFEVSTPWIDYAVQQARLLQEDVQRSVDLFAEASKSRLSQILSTSSAHLAQTVVRFRLLALEVSITLGFHSALICCTDDLIAMHFLIFFKLRRGSLCIYGNHYAIQFAVVYYFQKLYRCFSIRRRSAIFRVDHCHHI